MRLFVLCLFACAGAPPHPAAAPLDHALSSLAPLVGTWQGSDPDRHSTGEFTFAPELGGRVLVRRSVNTSPEGRHEDLMVVFATPAGLRASYFDNEGHAIQYAVAVTAQRVALTSDELAGQPRFALTYDLHGGDELAVDFAIAMPGAELRHYTGATVHRVSKTP
jgi:hypothetical protein